MTNTLVRYVMYGSTAPPARDPEENRMSLGDHLEELRRRIFIALGGLVVAAAVCSLFAKQVIAVFSRPLVHALAADHINPQMFYASAVDPFKVYIEITMVCAVVVAAPWIIWQLWLFIAAGLYENERKAIWRYAPLSIALMVLGVAMCYFVVLPLVLRFFIAFGNEYPLQLPARTASDADVPMVQLPALEGDPANPAPYQMWFDTVQQRLKFALPGADGKVQTMVLAFGPQSLIAPQIQLQTYVDMALKWLVVFGIAFQLPLVTMALARIGVMPVDTLRRWRRYVYFALVVISAILIPEVLTGMLALALPLWGLYEFGILLASRAERRARAEAGE